MFVRDVLTLQRYSTLKGEPLFIEILETDEDEIYVTVSQTPLLPRDEFIQRIPSIWAAESVYPFDSLHDAMIHVVGLADKLIERVGTESARLIAETFLPMDRFLAVLRHERDEPTNLTQGMVNQPTEPERAPEDLQAAFMEAGEPETIRIPPERYTPPPPKNATLESISELVAKADEAIDRLTTARQEMTALHFSIQQNKPPLPPKEDVPSFSVDSVQSPITVYLEDSGEHRKKLGIIKGFRWVPDSDGNALMLLEETVDEGEELSENYDDFTGLEEPYVDPRTPEQIKSDKSAAILKSHDEYEHGSHLPEWVKYFRLDRAAIFADAGPEELENTAFEIGRRLGILQAERFAEILRTAPLTAAGVKSPEPITQPSWTQGGSLYIHPDDDPKSASFETIQKIASFARDGGILSETDKAVLNLNGFSDDGEPVEFSPIIDERITPGA